MSVSNWALSASDWCKELEDMKAYLAPSFGRLETRTSASSFLDGVLSGVERKTGWMLSEEAGLATPYRIQSLLGRSSWSADALCALVRRYAVNALADPHGVLVLDETGFLKKGTHSVGVGRQYCGTAGRIENCQVGVFACYASRYGHTLIDRGLYLPKDWANDPERRGKVHVPDGVGFVTKPMLAREMVERLLDEGLSVAYVLADSVYGSASSLRSPLERRGQPYILAVRSTHVLRFVEEQQFVQTNPATIAAGLAAEAWQALSAGEGAKGQRLYHWARTPLSRSASNGFERWLLFRRNLKNPQKVAYYFAFVRTGTSLQEMAAAAGLRWTVEECFLRAKDDLGLDHCEARSWHGWHRHISLVMAGAAFLAKLAADQRRSAGKRDKTSPKPGVA